MGSTYVVCHRCGKRKKKVSGKDRYDAVAFCSWAQVDSRVTCPQCYALLKDIRRRVKAYGEKLMADEWLRLRLDPATTVERRKDHETQSI